MATVLVLEDDRLSQRLIEKVFKNAGHEVLLADTVKDGLALLLRRALIDLVVLDSHLGSDHGWDFAAEVRRRTVYRQLPIVVYTGYTERPEVLRYAALKVQALHVKPIKADVLLGELDRALRQGERSRILQDTDQVCARLQIQRPEYAGLLLRSVTHFEEDRETIVRHAGSPRAPVFVSALDRLKTRGRELGLGWVEELVGLLAEQAQRYDSRNFSDTLAAFDAVVMAVRERAVSLLGPNGALAHLRASQEPIAPRPRAEEPLLPASDLAGALAREMVACPAWVLGPSLGRLRGLNVPLESLWEDVRLQLDPALPVGAWLQAIDLIEALPRCDLPDAARALEQVDGFLPACRRVVQRMSRADRAAPEEEIDALTAASRLGVLQAVLLAGVARVVRPAVPTPLHLPPWRLHVAMVTLLSFELGRLIRHPDCHLLAAGALAHHLGRWALLVHEPGLMGLALAKAAHGAREAQATAEVFGEAAYQLGPRLLAGGRHAPLLLELAEAREDPATTSTPEARVALHVVHLAASLARAASAEDPGELQALRLRLPVDAPVWSALRHEGVDLPRDPTELVEVALTLARSVCWIVREAAA